MFSDVNRGRPENSCGEALISFIKNYAEKIAIASFIIFAILFINLFAGFFICCRKKKIYEDPS